MKRSDTNKIFLKWMRTSLVVPALLSALTPTLALGQAADEVTLQFADGRDDMTGTLANFQSDKFYIQASVGLVVVPADEVFCIGAACPEGTQLNIENGAVVLTSFDGSSSVAGDLIDVVDGEYVIATTLGEQRIAVNLVNCVGDGCPTDIAQADVDTSVELDNGLITLTGDLVAFENDIFVLEDQVMGKINVSALEFVCSGPGCP